MLAKLGRRKDVGKDALKTIPLQPSE